MLPWQQHFEEHVLVKFHFFLNFVDLNGYRCLGSSIFGSLEHYCVKNTVQFVRCFRLMEHNFVISCHNPVNLYITEKLIKFSKSLFYFYLVISNTVFIRFDYLVFEPSGWALIRGGLLFEVGRLLNFQHFQRPHGHFS